MSALMHERTEDGRERHFMVRVDGEWVCECGEHRDEYGKPVDPPLMEAVE